METVGKLLKVGVVGGFDLGEADGKWLACFADVEAVRDVAGRELDGAKGVALLGLGVTSGGSG